MSSSSIPKTDILLLTTATPNGQKISCTLEELGINYETKAISLGKNEQKEDWFLKINPNGRIPALVDRTVSPPVPVFESGSMMLYLTEKYDPNNKISYPFDSPHYWQILQWLFFMNAGVGPMQGQANHFFRYAPEKIPYGIERYQNETRRLYGVLEEHLKQKKDLETVGGENKDGPWLVGDRMTIADIANFSWINWSEWAGITLEKFPVLADWVKRINERPGIQRGLQVPEPSPIAALKTKEDADRHAAESSKWVIQGQQEEAEKHK
ncbi:glutathione S-transferase [Geopyxis carbonaria]|nr:glutathione S-transferase [Geopyxis carbonaria]